MQASQTGSDRCDEFVARPHSPLAVNMQSSRRTTSSAPDSSSWLRGHRHVILFAIFGLALAVRVAATARFEGLSSPPNLGAASDQMEYEAVTNNLLTGHGYSLTPDEPTAGRTPGTPLALLVPYFIFGRSFLAARLWIILISAATCLLVARLATQLADWRIGLLSAGWLALYPGHLYYSMHLLSEPVFGFWLALACSCSVYSLQRRQWVATFLAGVPWALVILTRVEFLIVVPLAWLLLLPADSAIRRQVIPHLRAVTIVVVLALLPWVARNAIVMGSPMLSTQRGWVLWGAHNKVTMSDSRYAGTWVSGKEIVDPDHPLHGTEVEREHQAWSYGIRSIRENLHRIPYLTIMKLWRLLSPFFDTPNVTAMWILALGWLATAPFIVYGLYRLAAHGPQSNWLWMVPITPMIATIGITVLCYGTPRFRDAISPVLVVVAAVGLSGFTQRRTS